jgi:Ser/Thr protein kinase RdoA (MazF antagonist)
LLAACALRPVFVFGCGLSPFALAVFAFGLRLTDCIRLRLRAIALRLNCICLRLSAFSFQLSAFAFQLSPFALRLTAYSFQLKWHNRLRVPFQPLGCKFGSMFNKILTHFALDPNDYSVQPFGSGLINHTWKVSTTDGQNCYILQKINSAVFKHPHHIALNMASLGNYLQQHYPDYLFAGALPTIAGDYLYVDEQQQYYRLFPFVAQSHSIDMVGTPEQAFEAARQFARFTHLLSGFDTRLLQITIPQFHDLSLRYRQFSTALANGNPQRMQEARELISYLQEQQHLVQTFEQIKSDPGFRLRVIHHDTKISNVLFDNRHKGLCVIDLDTVMPGYFISDVGDMMRTYLSPVSEEEKEVQLITIRDDFFAAIACGYMEEMKTELTGTEKQHFVYAGQFMIYMQALRFLTDHLNNDIYYGARYEGHNFIRARNQAVLLQRYNAKSALFNQIISTI